MSDKQLINFNLSEIAEGAVQAKFAKEVKRVCENILDLNTDAGKKRKITLTLTYIPDDQRNSVDVLVEAKSTLAPQSWNINNDVTWSGYEYRIH